MASLACVENEIFQKKALYKYYRKKRDCQKKVQEFLEEAEVGLKRMDMKKRLENIADERHIALKLRKKGDKMEIKKCVKESFSVIGKEGSTKDGAGFIQKLWEDANSHFNEVAHLAKKDENGNIGGIWGAMSDFSRSFKPWENHFTEGLYLAGVEVADEAEAPAGWVKWTIPGYEYLYVKCTEEDTFVKVLEYMEEQGIELAGAVHDFNCPEENGEGYMFFPIWRL